MQNKFKKHQKVILLVNPDPEYIEYVPDADEIPIIKGMRCEINVLLPNGKYHVKVFDKKGNPVAFVPMNEEGLGSAEE